MITVKLAGNETIEGPFKERPAEWGPAPWDEAPTTTVALVPPPQEPRGLMRVLDGYSSNGPALSAEPCEFDGARLISRSFVGENAAVTFQFCPTCVSDDQLRDLAALEKAARRLIFGGF